MNTKTLLSMLISFAFLIASCGTQATPEPTSVPTETLTPIPPTETPTFTPEPTNTPTATPTPIGGKDGLLLHQIACDQNGNCEQKIFLYDLVSQELIPFLEGYVPLDVSPDGKMALLIKSTRSVGQERGDLFIFDFEQPEQITLLQENVEDAVWLGDSGWIGLIKVSGKRQGFILRPDGSELTQITKSSVGVAEIKPVFNDGIFWSEGTVSQFRIAITGNYWTKLDGTETRFVNFVSVFPNGNYVITHPVSNPKTFELTNLTTGEIKEISPSKLDANLGYPDFNVLLLMRMASIETEHRIVNPSNPPEPYDLLSPDGVWILVSQYEKISDKKSKTTYYLFNTITSQIKNLPNLYAIETGTKVVGNRLVRGEIEGCIVFKYFWIEIP